MSRTAKIDQLLATATALLEEARRLSTPTPKPRPQPAPKTPQEERVTDEEVAKCFAELRAMLAAQ